MDTPEPWHRVVVCLRHQQFLEWCRQNGERASQHMWVGDPSCQALRGHRFEVEDIVYTGEKVSDETIRAVHDRIRVRV